MNCPSCQSENTQRLQVAYEYGTQNISTESRTVGILGQTQGGAGGVGSVTKTTGQAQSILAQKAAPPAKRSYKWPIIIFLIGMWFITQPHIMVYGLPFLGIGAYWWYLSFTYNSQVWPGLYQKWTTGWVCHKCGSIYHQS